MSLVVSPAGAAREDWHRCAILEKGSLAFLPLALGSKLQQREQCGVRCLGRLGIRDGVRGWGRGFCYDRPCKSTKKCSNVLS